MRKYIFILLLLTILVSSAAADGMAFKGDRGLMLLQPETEQAGAIYYENGYENMLIAVSLDWSTAGNQSVWIFPVPASPDGVAIDVVRGYPAYSGTDLERDYSSAVTRFIPAVPLYALFPFSAPIAASYLFGMAGSIQKAQDSLYEGVQVYDRVEKMGLTTELVTADNATALEQYLGSRGIVLPPDSKPLLGNYIGRKYSFVITTISDVATYRSQFTPAGNYHGPGAQDILAVSVRFPMERAYFPLKLTRAYGNRTIPILITINGYVTPQVPENIVSQTAVSYHSQRNYIPEKELQPFFNGREQFSPFSYTKIRITTPSENLTDDLWMDINTPPGIIGKDLIARYPMIWGPLAYMVLSMLASLIAGILVFRAQPIAKRTLLVHGLWNCITIIGFIYATRTYLEENGKMPAAKKIFLVVFYLVFFILLGILSFLMVPGITHNFMDILVVIGFCCILLIPGYVLWSLAGD